MLNFCLVCDKNTECEIWLQKKILASSSKDLYGASAGIPGTQDLVKCSECQFIFEINRPKDSEILEGYKSTSNKTHDSQFALRVDSFYKTIQRINKFIPNPPSSILDIGCAGGAFLQAASKFGYRCYGIEPSEELVKSSRERTKLDIRQGTAEELKSIFDMKFDVVSLWDVIEHVLDPIKTLENAISVLNENGTLIINIPDIGTLMAKIVGKRNWWISSVHLYHFNQSHLETILKKYGYVLIGKKRFFQDLEFGYLVNLAIQMKIPFTRQLSKMVPRKLNTFKIRYYASQNTYIFRPLGAK